MSKHLLKTSFNVNGIHLRDKINRVDFALDILEIYILLILNSLYKCNINVPSNYIIILF